MFGNQMQPKENVDGKYIVYSILAAPSLLYGCETKGCSKSKDSRDEIHETHSRIQLIGP
jgi:hypothetical protein